MSGAAVERYYVRGITWRMDVGAVSRQCDCNDPCVEVIKASAHDAAIAALTAELQQCGQALQSQYDSLTRELERIHALLKAPGDKPHLMTVWTHLNSMHNAARAALKEQA